MALHGAQEVTLTLTVKEKSPLRRIAHQYDDTESESSSEYAGDSTVPMTVFEDTIPNDSREGRRLFRVPWGTSAGSNEDDIQARRLEKEKEAEDHISSLAGRSLSIQKGVLDKVLSKEKRKVKFGLSSGKVMDLAIRRYTFKFTSQPR
jgi:hypothetical protein